MYVGLVPKSECIRLDGSTVELVGEDVATLFGKAASLRLLTAREATSVKHSVEMRRPISKRSHYAWLFFFCTFFLQCFAMEGDEIL